MSSKTLKIFKDRPISSVPYPAINKLNFKDVYDEKNHPRIDILKDHFFNEGRLEESVALKIINDTTAKFKNEKTLVEVSQPVCIVGDIHGQFYDLIKILEIGGDPKNINYLFLGDYVDRGHFSIECVLLLWALKLKYPNNITLLRGNHECKHLTDHFTFKRECEIKYSLKVYDACIRSFCLLPLCAIVNKQLFCVHGGLSPELEKCSDLNKLNRDREPPSTGLMCDLLWSDPATDFNEDKKTSNDKQHFSVNLNRGCSYFYNFSAVNHFLKTNDLLCLIRAHEAQDNGFRLYKNLDKTKFPSVITVFSAPNYLDVYNNKGAIIIYDKDTMNTKQFSASTHPYWLPNFMDVFSWSLPFVAEKVTDLFVFIFKMNIDQIVFDRREVIRAKLSAISRVAKMYSKARVRSEDLIQLKGIAPSSMTHLNSMVKSVSEDEDEDTNNTFLGREFNVKRKLSLDELKELDKLNECFPKIN
ncbi:unnamed protein product [Brachionus calyciflorus]|uniref:Serine/threonine-protein phosphatase n=1 Tax=Brachionus calyciflorus TaxID=104777 RepID=A0A814FYQ8_9BILA|nr:unnamed protein product [Brachionus calyciflorus]